jgi:hypothetical protein
MSLAPSKSFLQSGHTPTLFAAFLYFDIIPTRSKTDTCPIPATN